MKWFPYKRLAERGVLSLNRRNSDYILRYNERKRYPLVDDKLKTKRLAIQSGMAVPTLYQCIEAEHQIKRLENVLDTYNDFVIKPAHGVGGDGILVIKERIFGQYRQTNGKALTHQALQYHLSCILAGAYSIGGNMDYAMIERRVVVDSTFERISYEGVPDIRIIVLLGYPAIAMARLPTRQSNGKANLHQGAIGVGIDLATGLTLGGVYRHGTIDYHPDTFNPIVDLQVPYWDKILEIAARCYELTGLGYLGVDIVLDKDQGPLILEMNARPGLNIQIANREGILPRYQAIEMHANVQSVPESVKDRVLFSKAVLTRPNRS